MGFLRVVIGPEGIKMEEEKVKGVLKWPMLKSSEGRTKILRTGELLLLVYRRICKGGKTTT